MIAASALARLHAISGTSVRLGALLARGGEGRIVEVLDEPDLVAKLYDEAPDNQRATKLLAMAAMPPERRPAGTAWPTDVLLEADGRVVGFTMPRLHNRHDLFRMAASGDRRRFFPGADYRALVATAANLSRAIASVHAAGHVVGDVNERVAMVDSRCTVTLIDCDSFQVAAAGKVFPCDVGTALYQPPELQDVTSFRGLLRLRDHDCFGLAVLVFQLLFLNRHPFAGRYAGIGEAPNPPEAIRRHAFAWAIDPAARGGLTLPPNALSLASAGETLASLFSRAFSASGVRPSARDWAISLDAHITALKPCAAEPRHWHVSDECQLCLVERMLGAPIFATSQALPCVALNTEVDSLWRAIAAVPAPEPRPPPPDPRSISFNVAGRPFPELPRRTGVRRLLEGVGLSSTATHAEEMSRRREAVLIARARYTALRLEWERSSSEAEWRAALPPLRAARDALRAAVVPVRAGGANATYTGRAHALLASHPISDVAPTPRLLAALLAQGITDAAALSENTLACVPGISYGEVADLLAWRDALLRRNGASADNVTYGSGNECALTAPQEARTSALLQALRAGHARLVALVMEERAERARLHAALEEAAFALAKAEADAAMLPPAA